MRRLSAAVVLACTLAAVVSARQTPPSPLDPGSSAFESYLELLRQQTGIPGLSALLLQDGVVVWERGLGFANVDARIRATPDTPYAVGDLTQTFSSVLLLQCVQQRRLNLDEPVQAYGASVPDPGATLRQVMSHTTSPAATATFRYDAARFAQLAAAIEHCAPQPFRKSVSHRLLEYLAMVDSVPGRDFVNANVVPEGLFEPPALSRYARVLENLAVPYRVDKRLRPTRSDIPIDGINAATGLVSTVRDLARFEQALDAGLLIRDDTRAAAWTPVSLPNGTAAPTGLGWFVQSYRGTPVVWQFGLVPNGYSSIVVKVPARRATMILLANSDGLAVPFQLEAGDVSRSLFAALFLRLLL